MKSPLTTYKEQAKEFNITEDKQIPGVAKLNFARTQVQEQQQIINRLLVDLTMTLIQAESAKDDNTKSAYEGKATGYRNDLRQLTASLDIVSALVKELEKEVGQTSSNPTE